MLAQTLSAGDARSAAAAAAAGGGRDGVRANGGSPASAAPVPPNNTEIDPLATYTRCVCFSLRTRTAFAACTLEIVIHGVLLQFQMYWHSGGPFNVSTQTLSLSFSSMPL